MADILTKVKLAINKVFPFMELPLSISRQSNFPLDKSSIWWDKAEAENYAKTDPTAYPGQPITIVDETNDTVTLCVIKIDGTLEVVGSLASVNELKKALEAHKVEYNALKTAHDALSTKVTTLEGKHSALEKKFNEHKHNADAIEETTNRVFLSPEEKTKLQEIEYATDEDIRSLFPELNGPQV